MIHINKNVHKESYNRWFVGLRARKNKLKKKCVSTVFILPVTWCRTLKHDQINYWTEQLEQSHSSTSFGSILIIISNCPIWSFPFRFAVQKLKWTHLYHALCVYKHLIIQIYRHTAYHSSNIMFMGTSVTVYSFSETLCMP
jgi:hypothetical protein